MTKSVIVIIMLLLAIPEIWAQEDYERNLQSLQQLLAATNATWRAGVTSVGKLTVEQKRRRCGRIPPTGQNIPEIQQFGRPTLGAKNWHAAGYVTPVRDQGDCGSCTIFGECGAAESYLAILTGGLKADISEQDMMMRINAAYSTKVCAEGAAMIWPQAIFTEGVVAEACCPYQANDNVACPNCPRAFKIPTFRYSQFVLGDVTNAKWAVENYGPLAVSMTVYADFYDYKVGIYQHASGANEGEHVVLLYGYDDSTTPPCWLCKNSWGTDWGEQGHFRIAQTEGIGPNDIELGGTEYVYFAK